MLRAWDQTSNDSPQQQVMSTSTSSFPSLSDVPADIADLFASPLPNRPARTPSPALVLPPSMGGGGAGGLAGTASGDASLSTSTSSNGNNNNNNNNTVNNLLTSPTSMGMTATAPVPSAGVTLSLSPVPHLSAVDTSSVNTNVYSSNSSVASTPSVSQRNALSPLPIAMPLPRLSPAVVAARLIPVPLMVMTSGEMSTSGGGLSSSMATPISIVSTPTALSSYEAMSRNAPLSPSSVSVSSTRTVIPSPSSPSPSPAPLSPTGYVSLPPSPAAIAMSVAAVAATTVVIPASSSSSLSSSSMTSNGVMNGNIVGGLSSSSPTNGSDGTAESLSATLRYLDCPICLSLLSSATETECCHSVFCHHCLLQVLQATPLKPKPGCPTCRAPLTIHQSRPNKPLQAIVDSLPTRVGHNDARLACPTLSHSSYHFIIHSLITLTASMC
jgi:hypothetical protein